MGGRSNQFKPSSVSITSYLYRRWFFFKYSKVGRPKIQELFRFPLLKWTSIHEDFEPSFLGSKGACLSMWVGWARGTHQLAFQLLSSSNLLFSFLSSLKVFILSLLKCTTFQCWNTHLRPLLVIKVVTIKELFHIRRPTCKLILLVMKSCDFKDGSLNVNQN